MTFYRQNPEMAEKLKNLVFRFEKENRPNLHKNIAISWIRYENINPKPGSGIGANWQSNKLFYPASIVKLVYAIATEEWLQKDLILDSNELRRALYEMIANSNNDATSFILDVLTATTSGPSLIDEQKDNWQEQRNLINQWLKSLNWQELEGVNCNQKTWADGPYGREKDFYGIKNNNRNALTTDATARLLEAIMTNEILSPVSNNRIKDLLARSLDLLQRKANPENQIDGFLGEGLPNSCQLWSKAGLMSEVRHDAAWWLSETQNPILLVVFTNDKKLSNDTFLLPAIANELNKFSEN